MGYKTGPFYSSGEYSYIQPDGKDVTIKYKADETGYHVLSKSEVFSSAERDLTPQYGPEAPKGESTNEERAGFKNFDYQHEPEPSVVVSQPAPLTYSYVPASFYQSPAHQPAGCLASVLTQIS